MSSVTRKSIVFCVGMMVAGCATHPTPVVTELTAQKQIDEVKRQTYSVLRENVERSTPPLDLSEFKQMQFKIEQRNGVPLVLMQYRDFSQTMSLMHLLGTRIEVQKAYLDTTLDMLKPDGTGAGDEK